MVSRVRLVLQRCALAAGALSPAHGALTAVAGICHVNCSAGRELAAMAEEMKLSLIHI